VLLDGDTTVTGPYARAARLYRAAGWAGVLPLGDKPGRKSPPPNGFTGHGKPDPSGADIEAWIETHGGRNIGLRAPAGVLGLDVDAYEKDGKRKTGDVELQRLIELYGPLPATWVSGARPAPSGIYWFRVPTELDGRPVNWPGEAGKGIELVQHGHRYAVVWPSTNPDADGAMYGWRLSGTDDEPGPHEWPDMIPNVLHLPDLPMSWVRGLALSYDRTEKVDASSAALAAWWELLRPAPGCPRVATALDAARRQLQAGEQGRHEVARDVARVLAAYGGEGHAGAGEALLALGVAFEQAVGPGREAEWERLLTGAVGLAMADNPAPRQLCACAPKSMLVALPAGTPPVVIPAPKPDEPLQADTLTDSKIAQVLCDELLHGSHCWAEGLGWFRWDGQRWRRTSEELVVETVRQWVTQYVNVQVANVFVRADKEAFRLLLGLESAYRLKAIAQLCRGALAVEASAFDSHPDLLNVPNGIVDLRTGELAPHDPAMRLTKITGTAYLPGATHPDWDAALGAVRDDVASWLRFRFGQSITGRMTPDDLLLILQGGGENGKSTILNAIKQAVGTYGTYISDRVLLAEAGAHPTEMMDFRGARFALTEELPDEARVNVKRLKDIIGTPTIKARYMRQDSVEFDATHSFFLSTNPIPLVTDTDHGTWRRLALVRFPYRFRKPHEPLDGPDDRRGDASLRDRLRDGQRQREAVLAWLVAGAVELNASGMPALPESVQVDTAAWRAASDPIEGFWTERLRPAEGSFILATDMLTDFNAYLQAQNQHEWSARRFAPIFAEHTTTKTNRVSHRRARITADWTRSYRPSHGTHVQSPYVPPVENTAGAVWAWWGVRFITGTESDQG